MENLQQNDRRSCSDSTSAKVIGCSMGEINFDSTIIIIMNYGVERAVSHIKHRSM